MKQKPSSQMQYKYDADFAKSRRWAVQFYGWATISQSNLFVTSQLPWGRKGSGTQWDRLYQHSLPRVKISKQRRHPDILSSEWLSECFSSCSVISQRDNGLLLCHNYSSSFFAWSTDESFLDGV